MMRSSRESTESSRAVDRHRAHRFGLKVRQVFVMTLVALPMSACERSASGPEIDFALTSGIVYGRVFTAAGLPVVGVTVRADVDIGQASCQSGAGGLSGGRAVVSDSAGRYRQVVTAPFLPRTMCVFVNVPAQANILSSPLTITGDFFLRMTSASSSQPSDSVQVDVRLP
jgi:hypothetical protein